MRVIKGYSIEDVAMCSMLYNVIVTLVVIIDIASKRSAFYL